MNEIHDDLDAPAPGSDASPAAGPTAGGADR